MTNHSIKTIDVHELKKRYDASPDLCLIDVREHHEWEEMRIPRAIHSPKDQLASIIEQIIPDKTCAIYLHCRGGVRSLYAANALMALGYQDVYSIDGGIMAWLQANYPILTG